MRNRCTLKQITGKVLRLAPGRSFVVRTNSERVQALDVAKKLQMLTGIRFFVHSQAVAGGYEVSATEERQHGNRKTQKQKTQKQERKQQV